MLKSLFFIFTYQVDTKGNIKMFSNQMSCLPLGHEFKSRGILSVGAAK